MEKLWVAIEKYIYIYILFEQITSLFLKAGEEWEGLETCNKQVYGPKAYLPRIIQYLQWGAALFIHVSSISVIPKGGLATESFWRSMVSTN